MGTRADFYVRRGVEAKWLGSIAWDGCPEGVADAVLDATSEDAFRAAVQKFLAGRDDATMPEMGWPWPWEDSRTTDYSYAFDDGRVLCCCFGHRWYPPRVPPSDEEEGSDTKRCVFPDMAQRKAVARGPRSGLIVLVPTR
jgi:hypothetical protein